MSARTIPIEERFWAKVNKNGPVPSHVPEIGNCWIWTGHTRNGYGSIWDSSQACNWSYAHRLSYLIHYGPIPKGILVCHRCDNPLCVRPDHHFLGDDADNHADMDRKKRGSRPPVRSGEAHHMVTLSDAQVEEIRSKWVAYPHGQRELAREYCVSQSTIWRLVHGVYRA